MKFIHDTHTHPFNGPFSGTTRVSRYQKGKTNLDFTEARDSKWQWHQLGHMQVCTSRQITTPAPHHSVFFTGRMPFLPPNQQHQSTEGIHPRPSEKLHNRQTNTGENITSTQRNSIDDTYQRGEEVPFQLIQFLQTYLCTVCPLRVHDALLLTLVMQKLGRHHLYTPPSNKEQSWSFHGVSFFHGLYIQRTRTLGYFYQCLYL